MFNNEIMKNIIYPIILVILLSNIFISCEKEKKQVDCPEAPTNLGCGAPGSTCAIYHNVGGRLSYVTVYLHWDSVNNADGYYIYKKGTNSSYSKIDTTEKTSISFDIYGSVIYAVTAYNTDCESDYSNEYIIQY